MYFEIFNSVLLSLKSRFDTESIKFFKSLGQFSIGEFDNVKQIQEFYRGDFEEQRFIADCEMSLNLAKRSGKKIECFKDAVDFLREEKWCKRLVPEYEQFVRLFMTIPGSSCTNERSFSTLRRLKNYLQLTMSQNRLNNVAILHVYSEKTDALDLEKMMDEFIVKNEKRTNVFALSYK